MVESNQGSVASYSPDMDGPTHEATYRGFVTFVEIASGVIICWVLALALGGVREAWVSAIVGVVLSGIAGALGAFVPTVGWRAPAAVAALLVLMIVFY